MSLEKVTGKIDGILQLAVLVISGVLWAVAGFPHVREIVEFGGLIITCFFIWWLTSRPQKKT